MFQLPGNWSLTIFFIVRSERIQLKSSDDASPGRAGLVGDHGCGEIRKTAVRMVEARRSRPTCLDHGLASMTAICKFYGWRDCKMQARQGGWRFLWCVYAKTLPPLVDIFP